MTLEQVITFTQIIKKMAKLKIADVTVQPEATYKVPPVASLSLPLSLATDQGAGVQNITKALTKIYEDQREKEDNSTYLDVVSKISPELSTIYADASNETDVLKGAGIFRDKIKEKDFLSQYPDLSRNAKDKINNWLVKQQIELLPKLGSKITENSIKKTEVTNDNYLTQLNIKRSSSTDAYSAALADKEFTTFTNSPAFKKIYDAKEYDKIIKDKNLQSIRFLIANDTKIDPVLTINNAETIANIFGEKRGASILENAKARLLSETTKTLDREKFEARASTQNQNTYFAELSLRINNANKNPNDNEAISNRPDLDFIYDLKNKGSLNSAQYSRLVQTYTKQEIISDDNFVNQLNTQIAIADTVDKIDILEEAINGDLTIMRKLGVDDLTQFNTILNSAKVDRKGFRQFQNYMKILEADMGDPTGVIFSLNKDAGDARARSVRATERYKSFVYDEKMKPEDAYLAAVGSEEKYLPSLKQLSKPQSFEKEAKTFNADNYKENFKALRINLADRYKNNTINFKALDKELAELDILEDVANLHAKYPGKANSFFGFKNEDPNQQSIKKPKSSIIPGK